MADSRIHFSGANASKLEVNMATDPVCKSKERRNTAFTYLQWL